MTARSLIFFLKAERGADLMLYRIEFHIFAPIKEKLFLLENSVLHLGRISTLPFSLSSYSYCCTF